MADAPHTDQSSIWLKVFFVLWVGTMVFGGAWAIYNINAPEPKPAAGGHGSMILPQDGEWAPHARIWPTA